MGVGVGVGVGGVVWLRFRSLVDLWLDLFFATLAEWTYLFVDPADLPSRSVRSICV